jgi:type I restriction enzyme S subunit
MDSSTGVPGLNRNDVYNVFLPVPPLTEQQRIAEILDAVDDSIQTHQKIVDKLSLAGGRLVDRFFLELVEGCPASAVDYKTIEAIGAHHRAFLKTGPFGSSLKGDDWVEQGVPVVTIGSLRDGLISEDQLFFVSERKAAILREYRLAEGDIVFSRVADVGRSAVVTGAQSGWVISSNLMRIAVDRSIATPQYVQLVIAHYAPLREQIRKFTNASGREVVNDAIMRKLRLPWVPIPAQNRLLDIVGEFRGITACEETILTKLEILKQGLMNDLLMGRVQVTDDGLKSVGAG